ncbi:MAG TPA: TrkA family potassium uptake protein [Dictyoglomaceae bacterium]|nr:TrkA family potassium uptake protein [Dictyoglomaceae bacterium]HOL39023.1 TrkA family potassium uptake protein [Dictyoglomaceae bacterium]HPP15801.1 TrkA family potassium uptake protein [Dictyoglomaceae bacterium]HPU42790.1 TrkA family potassium uptake protein [Dictyoglomaceae bacterium]
MKSLSYNFRIEKAKFNQFAVIGLGRFGISVAITLERLGCPVIAIDIDERRVEEVKDFVSYAKVLDSTNINFLREAGIQNADVVIVSIAHDVEASVLATLLVKELGVKYVIARAISEPHKKILEKIGADLVVFPEKELGEYLAQKLVVPNIIDYIEISSNIKIFEIRPTSTMVNKSLEDLDVRKKYNLNVLAIHRGGDIITPEPKERIKEGDILYITGTFENLNNFLEDYK